MVRRTGTGCRVVSGRPSRSLRSKINYGRPGPRHIGGNTPCRKCNDLAGLEIATADSYPLADKSEGDGCDHRFADTNSPEPVGLGSGASSPRVQASH